MKSLVQKLTEIDSPSGYEKSIRDFIRTQIEEYVDEIRVDALGNLIARKGKKAANGSRIMFSAHMDEIGVIATHIDEQGFIRFTSIGGVYPKYVMGERVTFLNGVHGVINSDRTETGNDVLPLDQLFIDVGATSRENCPVKVGEIAAFDHAFLDLGKRVVSKALDDRIGDAVQIELIRTLKDCPHEIYFVFSAQEEVGTRGAGTAAFSIDPDLGIAIDVTDIGDTPKGIDMEVSLGKGPAIKIRDQGMLSDPRLVQALINTAEHAGIPYQLEVLKRGSTDARTIQLSRAGVPATCISIPCRYIHSPSEMIDMEDAQNAVRLLQEFLSQPVVLE